MQKRHKILISAFSILLGIIIFSISTESLVNYQANLLANPKLKVSTETGESRLVFGSESEVYRFKVEGTSPFTLRYLSFKFSHSGLDWTKFDSVGDWKIYEVVNDQIDYSAQVGEGSELSNGTLKMKMFNAGKRDEGFVGQENVFVLVTNIIKTSSDTDFEVYMPNEGWSFVWGAYSNSWGTLTEKLSADAVGGLPTQPSFKN